VLRQVQAGRREVDRLAANLAYKHGHALCEKDDVGEGILWLLRALKGAAMADDHDLERAARLDIGSWWSRIHPTKLRFEVPGLVWAAAYSPDGRMVATTGEDAARLWDASTGEPIGAPLRHPQFIRCIAFSPDGRKLVTGCADGIVRIWDVSRGELAAATIGHSDMVSAVAFSPDGKTLLTGCYDNSARLWDSETGRPIGTPIRLGGRVASVAFSPDGKSMAGIGSRRSGTSPRSSRLDRRWSMTIGSGRWPSAPTGA